MSNGRSSPIVPICTIMLISFKSLLKLWNLESGNVLEFSFRYKHVLHYQLQCFIESLCLNISKFFIFLLLCVKPLQIFQTNHCRAANKAVGALTLPSSPCSHTCNQTQVPFSLSHLKHWLPGQLSDRQGAHLVQLKTSPKNPGLFLQMGSWTSSPCSSTNTDMLRGRACSLECPSQQQPCLLVDYSNPGKHCRAASKHYQTKLTDP